MRLIIASNNAHKVREISQIFGNYFDEICSMRDAGIDIDIVEDGETFEENALIKARAISDLYPQGAVLADDSGLVVDVLGGDPGVRSARYAGIGHDDAANNAKIISEMENVHDGERTCKFVSCIALCINGHEICVRGECNGVLGRELRGTNGFGYDPLFFLPELGRTFAQLSEDEKNEISHRARALSALRKVLGDYHG